MNLNLINKEFNRLSRIDDYITFEFEPKSNLKIGKRNIYYLDLKNDFVNEVNTFGFSPFILQKFENQRKDPNIMRYMNKEFNHGLTNFVRKQNASLKINPLSGTLLKEKKKKIKKNKNNPLYNSIYFKKKEVVEEIDKKDFLAKAFENLGGNKLNISSDEEDDNANFEAQLIGIKNSERKNDNEERKLIEETKQKIMKSLRDKFIAEKKKSQLLKEVEEKEESLPQISISEFNRPDALKLNFEKLFSDKNVMYDKKLVSLNKNKEFLIKSSNKINTKNLEDKKKENLKILPNKNKNLTHKTNKSNTFKKKYYNTENNLNTNKKNDNEDLKIILHSRPLKKDKRLSKI
jgi:hypothetical protein